MPERRVHGIGPPEGSIPDPRELRERDAQPQPAALLPADRRVLSLVQRAADRLDECVARGRVRVATVHVRDEKGAGVGLRAREDADLLEDDLGSGV